MSAPTTLQKVAFYFQGFPWKWWLIGDAIFALGWAICHAAMRIPMAWGELTRILSITLVAFLIPKPWRPPVLPRAWRKHSR